MFKRIAQKLRSNKSAKHISKIRVEYGSILGQSDCEAMLFFMRPNLQWGGELNVAVLEKAGEGLDTHILENVHKPKSGEVYALPGFGTQFKNLFMAVLPEWDGGIGYEERDMLNCYRHLIEKAHDLGIKTIAIPAMGRDKRDFPHIRFARVALQGIMERLDDRLEMIKIVCVDRTMMATYEGQIQKMKKREGGL